MIKKEQIRMVKHVILWKLKEELTDTEKEEVKKGIKEALKDLQVRFLVW